MKCCRRYVSQTFAINTFRFAIFSSKKLFPTRVFIHRKFFNHFVNIFVKKSADLCSSLVHSNYGVVATKRIKARFVHQRTFLQHFDNIWNKKSVITPRSDITTGSITPLYSMFSSTFSKYCKNVISAQNKLLSFWSHCI